MAYKNNIPQPTDILQTSQGDLLGNFEAIKIWGDKNHVTFDDANQGKHTKVELPNLGVTPIAAVGDSVFYNNTSTLTNQGEVFLKRPSSATPIPITANFTEITREENWYYTPSGLIVKYGFASGSGLVTTTFNTGTNFPPFTVYHNIIVSVYNPGAVTDNDDFVQVVSIVTGNPTSFQVYCTARTTTADKSVLFMWQVIGS